MAKFQTSSNKSSSINFPTIRPSLDLDFANSKTLDPRITFTRSSGGSYVGPDGIIKYAGVNQPRFDHDPTTGESLGLLIEESRTNLLTSSNNFGAGDVNFGVTANATTSPDGTTNASKIFEKVTNSFKFIGTNAPATSGTTYCGSVFVKAGENVTMFLKFTQPNDVGNVGLFFNMNTGKITFTVGSPANYGVITYPNGWYRIYVSFTATQTTTLLQIFLLSQTSSSSLYLGDGVSGFYLYGAQVEVGAFPTSYIPTVVSTKTRSADLARLQDPYFSQFFNKYEGTVFMNYNIGSTYSLDRTQTLFYIGDKNDGTYQGYGVAQSTSTDYFHRLSGQAASQRIYIGTGNVYTDNSPITNGRFCVSYDTDKLKLSCDKLKIVSFLNRKGTGNQIQSVTTQVFNEIAIGWGQVGGASNRYITGTIKKLQYYPKALNDAQMLSLVN
jgi:hypothetical protein